MPSESMDRQVLRSFTAAVSPLQLAFLAWRRWFSRRPVIGPVEKWFGRAPAVAPGRIIVHGVSLGETALMRPLVPLLEQRLGPCLLTSTTETGWAGLAKSFPDHPRAFWPFDLPWAVDAFLDRVQPRALVLMESEFWPVMVAECRRRNIPVVVANARLSERSYARFGRLAIFRRLLASYAGVAAQNETHAARFRDLGLSGVAATGTMKADLVRPAGPEVAAVEAGRIGLSLDRPLLLLASTSPDEEAAILNREHLAWWQSQGWQVAIAPRHPERGPALADLVRSWGGTPWLTANSGARPSTSDVVPIINEIGRLGALYALSACTGGIAVVGGSLGSGRGGQNMLEAAAHGCATVVGWDVKNQPDGMALLRQAGGVVELTLNDLHGPLQALATDGPRRQALGGAGKQAWSAGLGAAGRTADHLVQILTSGRPRTTTSES